MSEEIKGGMILADSGGTDDPQVGVFKKVIIKEEGSETSVTITPQGIWVQKGGAVAASIQIDRDMPMLVVMDHRVGRGSHGHQLAFYLDSSGNPMVQIVKNDGKMIHADVDKLIEIFG